MIALRVWCLVVGKWGKYMMMNRGCNVKLKETLNCLVLGISLSGKIYDQRHSSYDHLKIFFEIYVELHYLLPFFENGSET